MCGILGVYSQSGQLPSDASFTGAADTIQHRGPDDFGTFRNDEVLLGHRRLAIIDLNTGHQPIHNSDKSLWVVFNGEIYNYVELRQELGEDQFQTRSDCETPLLLYRRDGLDFARALRGMYALAIHDPAEGRLILARDPFGIKPLYYVETSEGFAFASEAQALVRAGFVTPEIDPLRREELLQLQFTCGADTILSPIKRVLPGETLVIQGGHIVERRRFPALPGGGPESISEDDALARLDKALKDSTIVHQRSDVPYGLFLSGGIDSSALLALMAELNDKPVVAFTAGFSGSGVHDERDHARMLAARVGADHHEVDFGEADFWETLPRIAAAMDDPAADYAILPTWKLASVAAQELKVVLCGEGGDELFAGYGRYRSLMRPWWMGGRNIRHRGTFDGLDVLRDPSVAWRDSIIGQEAVGTSRGRNRLQNAQAIDCADWLTNDLLTKLDRCLMAHGLEGRTPFLDPVVAEAAFRLPDSLKINKRLGKWLLREWLQDVLPEAKPFEKKRGFTVPVGEWISSHGTELGKLVARRDSIREIADPARVQAIFERSSGKREGFAAWTLLFYALWHRANVEGRAPGDGTVFDILEAS